MPFPEAHESAAVSNSPDLSGGTELSEPYRQISEVILHRLAEVGQTLTQLTEEPSLDDRPVIFNVDTVNQIAVDAFGPENAATHAQMGKLFEDLTTARARNLDVDDDERTALTDGLGRLVFGDIGRSKARRAFGAHITKARQLSEFCNSLSLAVTPEADQINRLLDKAITDVLATRNDITEVKLAGASIDELNDLLEKAHQIDPETSLSALKLISFVAITDALSQPLINKAWRRIFTDEHEDIGSKIIASEFGLQYEASGIIDDIQTEEGRDKFVTIELIRDLHIKSKRLPMQGRAFKAEFERLDTAALAYANLVKAEKWLQDIKERSDRIRVTRTKLIGRHATSLAMATSKYVEIGTERIAQARDGSISASAGDSMSVEDAWQNAIAAEELIVTAAKNIFQQFKSARLMLSPEARTKLLDSVRPKFRDGLDQARRAEADRQLQPEIDRHRSEFKAIDDKYNLSGKKMRERDPRIIGLAHKLSEGFTGQGSPDDTTIRTMVGLMLGIYREEADKLDRTEMTERYLDDANQLREISSQLDKLGQHQDSRLLRAINLLDELIDSGAFDNTKARPELETLVDFVLHYLDLRDGPVETITTPEAESEAMSEHHAAEPASQSLGELPTEIIGQATAEDILVFPPGSSFREIAQEYSQHIEPEDEATIHWERIKKLVELRDHSQKQKLEANFIRTKQASWHRLPFFVLEVSLPGSERGVAVVESPVYGNATYVFREADDRLPWRDAVKLTRQEAREWGAVPAVHVDDTQLDKHMKKLWDRIISELTIL